MESDRTTLVNRGWVRWDHDGIGQGLEGVNYRVYRCLWKEEERMRAWADLAYIACWASNPYRIFGVGFVRM